MAFLLKDERLRAMYAGGRGNATARGYACFWAWVQARGLLPRRWVTLEVPGRKSKSGRATRFPVEDRAPVLVRYVEKVPGSRPHIPVAVGAPLSDFDAVAVRYPVFRIDG